MQRSELLQLFNFVRSHTRRRCCGSLWWGWRRLLVDWLCWRWCLLLLRVLLLLQIGNLCVLVGLLLLLRCRFRGHVMASGIGYAPYCSGPQEWSSSS